MPDCSYFRDYSQRDAPAFASLLCRFWLSGLFFLRDNVCLCDRKPSPSFDSRGMFWCHSLYLRDESLWFERAFELTKRLPCPRFWLKVSIFWKKEKTSTSLARRGWLGIIFLITPVFRSWKNACISSARSVQKHTVWDYGIVFVILPLQAYNFETRVEY